MAKLLVVIKNRAKEPTLDEVMAEFGLGSEDLDPEYGVQMVDPSAGDYAILVEEAVAQRISPDQSGLEGPYADLEIETFGPPEP